jgi:predicted nucleotidyltransferase
MTHGSSRSLATPPDLPDQDKAEILHRLQPLLRHCGGRLVLFGSRARRDARAASDIDLAIRGETPVPPALLAEARQALEDSRVPFRVDLLDYAAASPELQRAIDREGIEWTA